MKGVQTPDRKGGLELSPPSSNLMTQPSVLDHAVGLGQLLASSLNVFLVGLALKRQHLSLGERLRCLIANTAVRAGCHGVGGDEVQRLHHGSA